MAKVTKKTKAATTTKKTKRVLIVTPCYNGMIHMGYMTSVMQVLMQASARGYDIEVFTNSDSLITRARNNAVATFLDGTWDYLFWIDSDIGFKPDQFFRVLDADRGVAAAAYPLKTLYYPTNETKLTGGDLAASMLRYAISLEGDVIDVPEDGFVKVVETATGFMCISRKTLKAMIAHYPELKYNSDQDGLGAPKSKNHYLLFDTMVDDGRYLSEDYAFCRRARDMDIPIWLDMRSELIHTGVMEYRGSIQHTSKVNS